MKLEQQLLPHTGLKPLHDQAVWVYVYQTFTHDAADRAAERIALRFGVTSWPQLLLVDPGTLAVVGQTGRTVASFTKAFAEAPRPGTPPAVTGAVPLAQLEQLARTLEEDPRPEVAERLLGERDVVVRYRALQVLAERKPALVVERAATLLQVPNDAFRYLVCEVLAKAGAVEAAPALEALVREPKDSRNPNVLRIRAVQALATCGRAESVAAIVPHATSGVYFNGLTGVAVDTLAALAKRLPAVRAEVARALRTGYPTPPAEDPGTPLGRRQHRAARGLAQRIHEALGDPRPFPAVYDEAARARLATPPEETR